MFSLSLHPCDEWAGTQIRFFTPQLHMWCSDGDTLSNEIKFIRFEWGENCCAKIPLFVCELVLYSIYYITCSSAAGMFVWSLKAPELNWHYCVSVWTSSCFSLTRLLNRFYLLTCEYKHNIKAFKNWKLWPLKPAKSAVQWLAWSPTGRRFCVQSRSFCVALACTRPVYV